MQLFIKEYCLYCDGEIAPQIDWGSFFLGPEKKLLCESCKNRFERINGATCRICCRPMEQIAEQFQHDDLCNDCLRWESNRKWKHVLNQNSSLFVYNDFMAEVIARFKYRGDYLLVQYIAEQIKPLIVKHSFDYLVPIPLSKERLYERGFNQAEAIGKAAGFHTTNLLTRVHTEKQSKKTRAERMDLEQIFRIASQSPAIDGKYILLIDDIYTTGSTLRHAAYVLKAAGAARVQSVTVARG
ncbi:ComF family protein [Caldibacillus lycopersici]|uniref:ComF family protein n=1 Tax=Perspicuibacillus lycopersici TaxID=1325689 RepID=A0AAE3IUD0_9BACI|nr:ComF family protein [Perspicuibacillus lycopersici]MCU9612989.1 ComF family protein [Perspicuibacillus lycopersici]